MLLSMIYLFQACLGCPKKIIFLSIAYFQQVGRLFCLFFAKSAVEVFIWSFTYIFDKIGVEIRKVEEKK